MKQAGIIIVSKSVTVARIMMSYIKDVDVREITITGSERRLLQLLQGFHPRMVFIENCFMGKVTCDLIHRITRRDRDILITAFTVQDFPDFEVAKFIYWGAWSYLNLREDASVIAEAVKKILRGESYYPEQAAERVESFEEAKPVQEGKLTEREREIVKLIADNKTAHQMAEMLGISFATVKSHRENILKKIEGHGTADIIRYGFIRGIVRLDDYAGIENRERAAVSGEV
jgi:DNA-binding NarL/FixJ family response regulator